MHNQGKSNIMDWDMIYFGVCYCSQLKRLRKTDAVVRW